MPISKTVVYKNEKITAATLKDWYDRLNAVRTASTLATVAIPTADTAG